MGKQTKKKPSFQQHLKKSRINWLPTEDLKKKKIKRMLSALLSRTISIQPRPSPTISYFFTIPYYFFFSFSLVTPFAHSRFLCFNLTHPERAVIVNEVSSCV